MTSTGPSHRPQIEPDEKSLGVSLVPVDDLRVDELLIRREVNSAWVDHLMSVRSAWPPISVTADGTILDGVHRTVAAQRLGIAVIPAHVSGAETPLEQIIEAARANAAHGLRLTRAERSGIARRLLSESPALSDRKIAGIAGMSPTTVGKYRREGGASGDEHNEGGAPGDEHGDGGPAMPGSGVQMDGDRVQLDSESLKSDQGGPWWRRAWRWFLARLARAARRGDSDLQADRRCRRSR